MAGGAFAYRKGRTNEYRVRDWLRAQGWYVIRSYASKGPYDLLAMRPCPSVDDACSVLMVQVKTGKPYARPDERAALRTLARRAGAMPVVVGYQGPGKGGRGGPTIAMRWLDGEVPLYDPDTGEV